MVKRSMDLDLNDLMGQALDEAKKGFSSGEVPIGAVVATADGGVIARAHNQPIALNDPTAHAEILALRKAGLFFRNYRLNDAILVVTIEPCLMCMGAAVNARIQRLAYGAPDPKAGAAGSLYNLAGDHRVKHSLEVIPGILEKECRDLLQDFFRRRRKTSS